MREEMKNIFQIATNHKREFYSLVVALFIFLIPSNWFLKWIGPFAYSNQVLIDYAIPKLYLTDLFLFFGGIWGVHILSQSLQKSKRTTYVISAILSGFFLIQLYASHAHPATVAMSVRFLFLILSVHFFIHQKSQIYFLWIRRALVIAVFFQTLLATSQFFIHRELFGYWFFGEPILNTSLSTIAKTEGEIRPLPYGTFPHPNVLAGFGVWSYVMIWLISKRTSSRNTVDQFFVLICAGVLCVITQSLSATIALGIAFGLVEIKRAVSLRNSSTGNAIHSFWVQYARILSLLVCVVFVAVPLIVNVLARSFSHSASLVRRAQLNSIAYNMISAHPLFGVGLSQFSRVEEQYGTVTASYRFTQPVHHVGLLVLAELGFGGLFLIILFYLFAHNMYSVHFEDLFLSGVSFLSILTLDHYFFSLQQGVLMCSLMLAIIITKKDF